MKVLFILHFFFFLAVLCLYLTISDWFSSILSRFFWKWRRVHREPKCRARLVNLHPHYSFLGNGAWVWNGTFLIPLVQTAFLSLVSVCTSGVPISFMGNFWISWSAWGAHMLPETHSMVGLVNVGNVFSSHCLVDGRKALLLATLLCRSHSAGSWLERKCCFF